MVKKQYVLAIIAFLLIPAVSVVGGMAFSAIDPEIAARTANYARNYRLIALVKNFCLYAILLVNMGLWFLTCFLLLRSKKRSYWWLLAAILGPFGFIVLTILSDHKAEHRVLYDRVVRKLNIYLRIAYELCVFFIVWFLAYQIMVLKRELMITYQAAAAGMSRARVIDLRDASGGMWAFTEGLEVLYLVVLLYLLWPLCFNLAGHLSAWWSSPKKSHKSA